MIISNNIPVIKKNAVRAVNETHIKNNEVMSKNSANVSFHGGFFNMEKLGAKATNSNLFNNFMKMADNKACIFEAIFALGITCFARPLTILACPGPNKRDSQYASAQSIGSGISRFALALLVFNKLNNDFIKFGERINISKLNFLEKHPSFQELKGKSFNEAISHLGEQCKKNTDPFSQKMQEIVDTLKNKHKDKDDEFSKIINKFEINYEKYDSVNIQLKKFIESVGDDKKVKELMANNELKATLDEIKEVESMKKHILNLDINLSKAENFKKYKKFLPKGIKELNFGNVIEKAQIQGLEYLKNSKVFEKFNYIASSYGPKFIENPVSSYITILLIPPIIAACFKNQKKKPELDIVNNKINKELFGSFIGGRG
jgi:hypothetical protein